MQRHQGWADYALHGLLWLSVIVLVPLALVVGLGREWMPQLPSYKQELETWLSERAELDIRIGNIDASWRGLAPSVELANIQLYDPQQPNKLLLTLPKLSTELAIWESIRDANLRLRTTLDGIQLHIEETADGSFQVKELADLKRTEPGNLESTLRWLFEQPMLVLGDSQISLQRYQQPVQTLHDLSIEQFLLGSNYRAALSFRLSEQGPVQSALLEIANGPLSWRESPWRGYVAIDDVRVWQNWAFMLPTGWQVQLNGGSVKAWLAGEQGRLTRSVLQPQKLSGSLVMPGRRFDVDGISARAQLEGSLTQGRLRFAEANGVMSGRPLPFHAGLVAWAPESIDVYVAGMDVASLLNIVDQYQLMPAAVQSKIAAMRPSGVIPRLRAQAIKTNDRWQLGGLSAELKAMSWQPFEKIPGAERVGGWVKANATQGLVYLDSRDAVIYAPEVFREPIRADALSGGLRWFQHDKAWYLQTDQLVVNSPDAKVRAQMALQLPAQGVGQMELVATLHDAKVSSAWKFVPWKNTSEFTLNWLKKSLPQGVVDDGRFVYSGMLSRDHPQAAKFQMRLGLRGAELDYLPEWPKLTDLVGVVSIDGRDLQVHIDSGRVMQGSMTRVAARIPDLSRSVLSIDADLNLDLADLDVLLATSPTRRTTKPVADRLVMAGAAKARLLLEIPLAEPRTDIQVMASLDNASLALANSPLRFEQVKGQVGFDLAEGLTGSLSGLLWGQPARLELIPQVARGHWQQQVVRVNAPVADKSLSQWLGMDLSPFIRGQTAAEVTATLAVASSAPSTLHVQSELRGMAITLPPPLSKPANRVMPLTYSGPLGAGRQRARANVQGLAQAGLLWRDGDLQSLAVRVGAPGVLWQDKPGISVEADLTEVSTAAWVPWVERLTSQKSIGKASALAFNQLTLKTKSLKANGKELLGGRYELERDGRDWRVSAQDVRFADWPKWPATDAKARIVSRVDQWRLTDLLVTQPAMQFAGEMSVSNRTQLKGQFSAAKLENVLEVFAIDSPVSAKQVRADIDVSWLGNPDEFAMAKVSGSSKVRLGEGRILKLSALPTLSKVFGLLNAGNIVRRLRFDFSDVTRKGLSFDQVTFNGQINRGIVEPSEMSLEGPSMNLRSSGRIDLVRQEINQEINVDVPMSSAVPIVAGVLAGPIVGGALAAADLLLDKQLAKLTSLTFYASGNWRNVTISEKPVAATVIEAP